MQHPSLETMAHHINTQPPHQPRAAITYHHNPVNSTPTSHHQHIGPINNTSHHTCATTQHLATEDVDDALDAPLETAEAKIQQACKDYKATHKEEKQLLKAPSDLAYHRLERTVAILEQRLKEQEKQCEQALGLLKDTLDNEATNKEQERLLEAPSDFAYLRLERTVAILEQQLREHEKHCEQALGHLKDTLELESLWSHRARSGPLQSPHRQLFAVASTAVGSVSSGYQGASAQQATLSTVCPTGGSDLEASPRNIDINLGFNLEVHHPVATVLPQRTPKPTMEGLC